jgi:hypothetical protein
MFQESSDRGPAVQQGRPSSRSAIVHSHRSPCLRGSAIERAVGLPQPAERGCLDPAAFPPLFVLLVRFDSLHLLFLANSLYLSLCCLF